MKHIREQFSANGDDVVVLDDCVIVVSEKTIAIYENEEHRITDPAHPREITSRQGMPFIYR